MERNDYYSAEEDGITLPNYLQTNPPQKSPIDIKDEGIQAIREQDYPRALECFQYAAEHGVFDAMFRYGVMLRSGIATPKDDVEAFNWLKKAANVGHPQASYFVGEYYLTGTAVPADRMQAFKYIKFAAEEAKDLQAMYLLAKLYCDRTLPIFNLNEAERWMSIPANENFKDAAEALAAIRKINHK
jgi:TPR repeat protein